MESETGPLGQLVGGSPRMTFRQRFFNYMCSFLFSVQVIAVKINSYLFVNVDVYIVISWQGKISFK
jgi:hypothetical protein